MSAELVEYLSRYIPITDELADTFMRASLVREYRKGTVLLREGEPVRAGYFVLKGCVRAYVLKEGDDKTVDFYIEEDSILPPGLGTGALSGQFLECLEDTVAVSSTPEEEAEMLAKYPQLKEVCLAMTEVMAAKLQESLARYRTSTPEERYRDLMARRPDLLQRIPQYHIASFLGVKPESLSRIRKRMSSSAGGKRAPGERS